MLSPGHYLQLRRQAAGLSVLATAGALVGLPAALRRATTREINRMAERLHAAEADHDVLTAPQIRLLAEVIQLQPQVYLALRDAHEHDYAPIGLRICTGCGCTDTMACADPDHGSCAWSTNDPDLCTRCETARLDALLAGLAAQTAQFPVFLQGVR